MQNLNEHMGKQPRIALLSQHFSEYACRLAGGLAQQCEVMLVLNEENARLELGADWAQTLNLPSLHVVPLPKACGAGMVWRNYLTAKRAVRAFRPDVIHAQEGGIWDELVPLLLMRQDIPLVLTVHDPAPHAGADRDRLAWSRHRAYQALIRKTCDAAIVHGEALAALLGATDERFVSRVFTVPHGVLGPKNLEPGIGWSPGNFLFFGRIQAYKGLDVFVAAIRELSRRGIPARGVIAGKGPDLDRHRAQIEASPLFEVHDRFIPPDEVRQLFLQANAVVLPYVEGTQSGVAAMALGFGRPIVATRVGAIPELVLDSVNGLLVAPRAVGELADAMEKIILNPDLAALCARNSLKLGRTALSWREIAVRTQAVYRHAASLKEGGCLRTPAAGGDERWKK